jgi:oligosaccharide repeat unit polymerase
MELYYALLIFSVVLGIFLFYKVEPSIFKGQVNIYNWAYISEFIIMGAVSPFLILSIKKYNWALKDIPDAEFPIKEVIFALSWCAISIPVGIYLAKKVLSKKLNTNYSNYIQQDFTLKEGSSFYFIWLGIFLMFSAYLVYKIGFIPQAKVLGMTTQEAALLRGKITHNLPASVTLYRLIGLTIAPILTFASFSRFFRNKSVKNFCLFILFLGFSLFFTTLNLNKSSIAYIILGLIVVSGLINLKIGPKKLLLSFGLIFLTLILTFKITIPDRSIKSTVLNIFGRITISQTYGNYISLYLFPKHKNHIGFRSLTKQIKLLGIEPKERASRVMMKKVNPKGVKEGTAGYIVSTFFAEAWANWGLLGLILSPIVVGFILQFVISFLIYLPKSEITIGLITVYSYKLGIAQSFSKILLPRYIIVAAMILLISYYYKEVVSFLFKRRRFQHEVL